MNDKQHIDKLVARAKILANGRGSNKGRPRELMPRQQAETVSAMRKRGCAIHAIFRVMAENSMTEYGNYPRFKAAYTNHKLHS